MLVKPTRDKLACLLLALYGFFVIFFLVLLITAIWNTVWASYLSYALWENAIGTDLKDIVTYLACSCYLALFCIVGFLLALYFSSKTFMMHVLFTILLVCSLTADLVLIALCIDKTSSSKKEAYTRTLNDYMANNIGLPVVYNWMNSHNCNSIPSCNDALNDYIFTRCTLGYFFSISLLAIQCFGLFGICSVVFLMARLPQDKMDPEFDIQPEPEVPLPVY